jgi:hypothetical protein
MKNSSSFESQEEVDRRCLPCRMWQAIEDFFAEFPPKSDEHNAVLDAIAKLVADLTSGHSVADRQDMIRHLNRGIKFYDHQRRSEHDTVH